MAKLENIFKVLESVFMTDWDELNRKFSTGLSSIIGISPKSPQGAFSGD